MKSQKAAMLARITVYELH